MAEKFTELTEEELRGTNWERHDFNTGITKELTPEEVIKRNRPRDGDVVRTGIINLNPKKLP